MTTDQGARPAPTASEMEVHASALLERAFIAHSARAGAFSFAGHSYVMAGADDLASLGFDPDDEDLPLVILRESDGTAYQVDIAATVSELDPEVSA